jgi:hypothetical protein
MAVSIDVNGVAISYPQAGDVGWAADATQFAVQSSAALSKIGLSTGTDVVVQNTLEVLGDAILQSDLNVVGKLDVDNVEIANGLIVDTDVLLVDSVNNRVGINNAIPSQALDVIGDAIVSNDLTVGNNLDVALDLNVSGSVDVGVDLDVTGTLTAGTLTLTDLIVDTDLIKTDSANNRVGINIATPTEALDVVGKIKTSDDLLIGGELLASNGSVSNPSLSFTNDSNSGLYSISDNVIGLAINGTKRGEINTNGLQALDNILIVEDEKTANTAGGTFTSGAWRTRDLNTVRVNRVTGASLSSNQITLPAGTYRIFASAPAFNVTQHKLRLYNVTSSVKILDGTSERSVSNTTTRSIIIGEFTITVQSALIIEHRCASSLTIDGFGIVSNFSEPEIYTQVLIQRLA